MFDPDSVCVDVHWHVYIELDDGGCGVRRSTREDRLKKPPEAIYYTAEAVAEWICDVTGAHAHREAVHINGTQFGTHATGDEGHRNRDFVENIEVLARGDSLYYDFRRNDDRMLLIAEAVSNNECREEHST